MTNSAFPRRSYGVLHRSALALLSCLYLPLMFGSFVILAGIAIAIGVLALAVVLPALLRMLTSRA